MAKESVFPPSTIEPEPLDIWQKVRDIGMVVTLLSGLTWLVVPASVTDARILPVGKIQDIRFLGSFLTSTQIDVRDSNGHERNLLVLEMTHLHKAQEVVLRVGLYQSELCSVDLSVCERVKGQL